VYLTFLLKVGAFGREKMADLYTTLGKEFIK
jgi:hypothetical protein